LAVSLRLSQAKGNGGQAFVASAGRIAEKLRAEYSTPIGHRPAPSEMASWQNSLMALSMLVDQAELNDNGVVTASIG
jgi:hypothetical protein